MYGVKSLCCHFCGTAVSDATMQEARQHLNEQQKLQDTAREKKEPIPKRVPWKLTRSMDYYRRRNEAYEKAVENWQQNPDNTAETPTPHHSEWHKTAEFKELAEHFPDCNGYAAAVDSVTNMFDVHVDLPLHGESSTTMHIIHIDTHHIAHTLMWSLLVSRCVCLCRCLFLIPSVSLTMSVSLCVSLRLSLFSRVSLFTCLYRRLCLLIGDVHVSATVYCFLHFTCAVL